jgi:uncharacterized protein (DUF3820 family)
MDQARLKRRVEGRKLAQAILELVTLVHQDEVDGFLDELRSTLQPKEVLSEVVAEQRKLSELSAVTLPRGIHAGERLDDVPRDYLYWWIEDGRELNERIDAYLAATKHLDGES